MGAISVTNSPINGNVFQTQKLYNLSSSSSPFFFQFKPKVKVNLHKFSNLRMMWAISSLKNGEDSSLTEFKPSFDQYLKVMESVKTERKHTNQQPSLKEISGSDDDGKRKLKGAQKVGVVEKANTAGEKVMRVIRKQNEDVGVGDNLVKIIGQTRYDDYDDQRTDIVKKKGRTTSDDYDERRTDIVKKHRRTRNDVYDEPRTSFVKKDGLTRYDDCDEPRTSFVKKDGLTRYYDYDEPRTSFVKKHGRNRYDDYDESRTSNAKKLGRSTNDDYDEPRTNIAKKLGRTTDDGYDEPRTSFVMKHGRNRYDDYDEPRTSIVKKHGRNRNDDYDEPRIGIVKKHGLTRNDDYDEPRTGIVKKHELTRNDDHGEPRTGIVKKHGRTRNDDYDEPRINIVKKLGRTRNDDYDEIRVKGKIGLDSRSSYYDEQRFETRERPVISSRPSGNNGSYFRREGSAVNSEGANDVKIYREKNLTSKYNSDDDIIEDRAAFKSLDELDDPYDKPRVSRVDMEDRIQTLAQCLNGADIDMPEWIFSKMIRSAKIRFSDHSVRRLIQILGKFGNWRRVLQVVEWFQLRERFKSHKLRYIYTAAIDALGKARRPTEALNLFTAMKQQMSSYPDLVAYRSIAVTLGQAGYMKELFDVIDSMRTLPEKKFKTVVLQKWDPRLEPDIVVYNAVLNACVRRKSWEGAFWVFQQLKQQGLQPSSTTYGLAMEVMFACGKYNLVHEFFKKVQKSYIPNALTYKVLVNTLWRQGNVDAAVMAVQDMERRGIVGSAGLYYDLARCLCSAGRCQEAIMQMDKICKVATKPLVVTYTGLIQACLDNEKIESAIFIFNHMLSICPPNLVTYNIMLKGYLDHELFEEAKQLFQKLLENGSLVRSKQDYKEMVFPDIYTFNLMLDACAGKNRWDDFKYVYGKFLQHGYHFNAKRHLRMIMDAMRTGKVELLETTWKHLGKTDQLAPPPLIREMFRLKLEQDDFAAAISCIASVPLSESQKYSPKSWVSFFRENTNFFRKDVLNRLEHEVSNVISRSSTPNLIFQNLFTSCNDYLRTELEVTEDLIVTKDGVSLVE